MILDSHALIHRAFYGIRDLKLKDGTPINAVYGFTKILTKIIDTLNPEYFIVVRDMPGKTLRHEKFSDYKATRIKTPDSLISQIPLIYEIISSFDIPIYGEIGYEADDLAGSISKSKLIDDNVHRYLITGDFDYLQLIDKNTSVIHFKKGFTETKEYNIENFKIEMNFNLNSMLDYKGLVGDKSDNIPGVSGIGDVTAKKLLEKYTNLEEIYENLENIKLSTKELLLKNREMAFLSRDLSKIITDIDINVDINHCRLNIEKNINSIKNIFSRFEFYNLLRWSALNNEKNTNMNNIKQNSLF